MSDIYTRRNNVKSNNKNVKSRTLKNKNNMVNKSNTISDNISKKIKMNTNLIIEAYKNKLEGNPLPKFPKKRSQTFSEGFIRRMSEPLFL